MSYGCEPNTFGEREKRLIIQAMQTQGYIPWGGSEVFDGGGHYRELYVRIEAWTPSILLVDYNNVELWDQLFGQADLFRRKVEAHFRKQCRILISDIEGEEIGNK